MTVPDIHVILPGDIDDPGSPSGGNTYDRRVCRGLAAAGWSVRELAVAGAWPQPGTAARAELAAALGGVPDNSMVLLDGLVAGAVPELVVPHADRLRLVVLVHLPLGDETGLAAEEAAELTAREHRTLAAVAAIIVTSTWAAHRLVRRYDLTAAAVRVAAPGVDEADVAVGGAGTPRLVCVAALTPRKGHDVLIEALATVADRPWQCVCVGAPGQSAQHADLLRRLVHRHRLGDRVQFLGPRTGAELTATYATADLTVLASRAETYAMVVTESLARGVPVLATAVGGVPEALGRAADGTLPGMLVPPDDPPALAAAMRRWLDGPQLRQQLRSAALDRRSRLRSWDDTVRDVVAVLHRCGSR